jgi:hypothetical protein
VGVVVGLREPLVRGEDVGKMFVHRLCTLATATMTAPSSESQVYVSS